jgi:hypothetical protein
MNIAMSGSTGFIGTYLTNVFTKKKWGVVPLTRADFAGDGRSLQEKLSQADAVVNLAGAPIAARWTEAYKQTLYESRVPLTQRLVTALCATATKPRAFISACGVGIYPAGGPYAEHDAARADDFLGRLAQQWEQAALQARCCGIRTVVFRFGVVLGRGGGALGKMLPLFRLGLGGRIGNGDQPFSWVHIDDLARAHAAALENDSYAGAYNLTAPVPTTNEGLTAALARAVRRPALFPVPAFALKLALGEAATVLLGGQAVLPRRLLDAGFHFEHQTIEQALAELTA